MATSPIPNAQPRSKTQITTLELNCAGGPPADPLRAIGQDVINQCDHPAFCLPRATPTSTLPVGEPTIILCPDTRTVSASVASVDFMMKGFYRAASS